ncbi:MAG: twin-arginine translocase TatA/TatE family subunit [Ilumatobacteraceae bacterium]
MFNLQGSEIIVILLLALVVLGPDKLPDAIRKFMQTYSEFKKMSSGFQSELKSALDEPMREMRETATLMRDAVDPNKIVAEAEAEQRLREDAERVSDETADADADAVEAAAVEEPVDPLTVEPPTFDSVGDVEHDRDTESVDDIDVPPEEAAS